MKAKPKHFYDVHSDEEAMLCGAGLHLFGTCFQSNFWDAPKRCEMCERELIAMEKRAARKAGGGK